MALTEERAIALGMVGASRVLSDGDKRVWEKHLYLDGKGTGSVVSAATMGLMLGKESETVEACRRRLMRAGLLRRSEGRGVATRWFVVYPNGWLPAMSAKRRAEEYARAAQSLDGIIGPRIESRDNPRDSRSDSPPRNPEDSTGFSGVSSPASVRGEGKGGVPPRSQVVSTPLPAPSPNYREGTGLTTENRGGEPRGGPELFREVLDRMRPRVTP
jgi:hypothetical protein